MRLRGNRKSGRDRGFVEVGVAAAGALLVLGAVVGNGVAATILDMSDGQTWLPDDDGRVVQVNPATGEPERRLVVGAEGSEMEVAQSDGHLIVTDPATGEITAIDLTGLVASGSRGSEGDTWVLIGGGQVVLVEPSPGTVRAVDPLTLTDLGSPYRTDDLAHAVIDEDGSVWVLTTDGELAELDFAPEAGAFVVSTQRPVTGAGSASRLVPHSSGVTVFAPDGGAIVQVGAGPEVAVNVPALDGQVAPADRSDAGLVPASGTDVGRVFMLADGQVLNIDVGSLGCTRPGAPAVLAERVYVPCLGAGRVIVLDADGARAGDDVVVPGGGDPTLVVDEGRLFVHTTGDDRIVLVQPDGSTQVVDIGGGQVPEHAVDQPAPPRPPSHSPAQPPPAAVPAGQPPAPQAPNPRAPQGPPEPPDSTSPDGELADDDDAEQGRNDDDADRGTDDDADGSDDDAGGEDGGTDDDADGADDGDGTDDGDGSDDGDDSEEGDGDTEFVGPTDVQATVDSDDLVQVTWTAPETDVREYTVTSSDGSPAITAAGDATSATLDVASCETSVTITVTAHLADGDQASANTAVQLADCAPDEEPGPEPAAPTDVRAEMDGSDEVRVTWTAPQAAPQEYAVTSSDGSPARTVAGHRTNTTLQPTSCDVTLTITVTAYFPDGEQHSATTTVDVPDCTTAPEPAPPANVQASLQGDDEVRVSWTAPEAEVEEYIVTSSDGSPAQTVAGNRTTATLGVATCDATLTLTVTAHFAGGWQESATTTVAAPDCATAPDPAAPTNVQASLQGDDEVRVTWTAPEAPVQEYTVTSPDDSRTVAGSSTSATLGVSTCGETVTITVTADFGAGIQESATATVRTPDCAPDPVQATAPTNVQAEYLSGGQVRVSWTAASSGADTYLVRPSGGAATDAGTGTSVVLDLSPGSYTFTVETQLEGTQATSNASNSVTVPDVPSAPGSVGGSATPGPSQVQVSVSWGAADANGSAITGYRVSHSGPGGSAVTVTGTSTTLTINCSGQTLCLDGGQVNVQVQAVNGVGTGPATTGTINVPPADIPRNGDGVVTASYSVDDQTGTVTGTIVYQPNSTWANFSGTCTITVAGAPTVVSCSTPRTLFSGSRHITAGLHASASITASGGGVNATSSDSINVPGQYWCNPTTGICMDPVSLPVDPDVEHIPAPWTPPEVPNPPVLVAGIGLLGVAGVVRALRNRTGLAGQVLAGAEPGPAATIAAGDPPR